MPGKRVQIDEETWRDLELLGHDQMKDFQELADEAFRDLLKKYGRPVNLRMRCEKARRLRHRASVAATTGQSAAQVNVTNGARVFSETDSTFWIMR